MSQVPPSNDSPYGSQPYGQGPLYAGPGAPSAPYTQGGPDPYFGQQNAMTPAYGGNNPYDESLSYAGAGVSVPAPKGKKGPVILLSIALAMVLGALAIFIASVVVVIDISRTLTLIKPNGEVAADLKSTSDYALYSEGDPSCTVTAPNGSDVSIAKLDDSTVRLDGHRMVATFSSGQDGKHTISCTTPGSEKVYLGQAVHGEGVVGGALGLVGIVLLSIVGLPLLIGAIIWLVVRLSYDRKAHEAQVAMGGGYPGDQQWQQY
ncbi:hypothetical protein [Actinomyces dentalis]|jgi:hypothetical protein avisC_03885|uniref:hypothetical protein n=1 Tax=Actinomyces dentalis TaxID=272548 RepID=UPI0028EFF23D|nr:hypothetical protein [Actinomyces dentalis]